MNGKMIPLKTREFFYRYPADGTIDSVKFSAGVLDATPGTVTKAQVPAEKVQLKEDHEKPVIEDKTGSKKFLPLNLLLSKRKLRITNVLLLQQFFYRTDETKNFKKSKCRRTERTSLPFKNLCT